MAIYARQNAIVMYPLVIQLRDVRIIHLMKVSDLQQNIKPPIVFFVLIWSIIFQLKTFLLHEQYLKCFPFQK